MGQAHSVGPRSKGHDQGNNDDQRLSSPELYKTYNAPGQEEKQEMQAEGHVQEESLPPFKKARLDEGGPVHEATPSPESFRSAVQEFSEKDLAGKSGSGQQAKMQAQSVLKLDSGRLPDLEKALATSGGTIDLCGATFSGELAPSTLLVDSNTTLCNGTILLPRNSEIVIANNTQNVLLSNLTIRGRGGESVVQIQGSSSARMLDCTVTREEGKGGGDAVRVVGSGLSVLGSSSLVAKGCTMQSGSGSGLVVFKGGKVALDNCVSSDSKGYGWVVVGEGSRMQARGSKADGNEKLNVYVGAGASAVFSSCSMGSSSSNSGLFVTGKGSTATANSCIISGNQLSNVVVVEGAFLTLEDCECNGSKKCGWVVVGEGSRMVARDSRAEGNEKSNAWVGAGASAFFSCCSMDLSSSGVGLDVRGKCSTATAKACSISSNQDGNVWVNEGASLTLEDCECNGSKGDGWVVKGEGSSIVAKGSKAQRNEEANVWVNYGASAVFSSCNMGSSSSGVGLTVEGKGSTATAKACSISGNQDDNVLVWGGANATLINCESKGSKEHCGWWVDEEDSWLVASSSTAVSNADGNAVTRAGGKIVCLNNCDLGGTDILQM